MVVLCTKRSSKELNESIFAMLFVTLYVRARPGKGGREAIPSSSEEILDSLTSAESFALFAFSASPLAPVSLVWVTLTSDFCRKWQIHNTHASGKYW